MPINNIHIPKYTETGVPDYGSLVEHLAKGYEIGNLPKDTHLRQQKEEEAIKESLLKNALTKEFGRREKESDIGYKEAMTKNANNPFSHLTGLPAEYYGAQQLENQLGEEHPIVQQVKQGLRNKIKQMEVLNDYRTSLSETAGKRSSTSLGKIEQEMQDIESGYIPGSNGKVRFDDPNEQDAALIRARHAREKLVSDTGTRQKVAFATNIDKTLQSFKPEDLIQYSGPSGKFNLKIDEIQSAQGNPSSNFLKYQEALTSSKVLAKQIRQFYGDSVQPSVQEAIDDIVNPSTWRNSPEVALAKFNQLKNLLQKETQTYKDMSPGLMEDKNEIKSDLHYNPVTGGFE